MKLLMTCLVLLSNCPLGQAGSGAAPGFVESLQRIPKEGASLALRDFSGNGVRELARIGPAGIDLFRLGTDGLFNVDNGALPSTHLNWPAGRVGWDLVDLGADGSVDVLLLLESGEVRVHRLVNADPEGIDAVEFDEGEKLLQDRVFLPHGVNRVRFVRDVDGDGRQDLVLPGPGSHRIFLARDGGWSTPIEVAYDLRTSLLVGEAPSLHASFGQDVRVPWFHLEDVDGDGHADLVAETDDRIAFHLDLNSLSSEPTWVLSLEDLRAELPTKDGFDFDNLFSILDDRVTWEIADLDGEAPLDLLVMLGPKLRVYLGGSRTGPLGTPDQVLKSSGNVLWSFLRQVEGDESLDLQIARSKNISVGRVLRSLILPSSLSFDLYTYRNEGGSFSRKPTRRNSLIVEVPRLLTLINDSDSIDDAVAEQMDIQAVRLPRRAGSTGKSDGVVDIQGEEMVITLDCAPDSIPLEDLLAEGFDPEAWAESFFLEDFDRRGDGAERVIDIGDLLDEDFSPSAILRAACEGHDPSLRIPLAFRGEQFDAFLTTDIDGDGQIDVVVVGESDDEWIVQYLLLRNLGDR
ncbi:MAG: hypothetical protein ACI8QS_003493 [Planctomycetota bacterium]|jgi:hypothetical protein